MSDCLSSKLESIFIYWRWQIASGLSLNSSLELSRIIKPKCLSSSGDYPSYGIRFDDLACYRSHGHRTLRHFTSENSHVAICLLTSCAALWAWVEFLSSTSDPSLNNCWIA